MDCKENGVVQLEPGEVIVLGNKEKVAQDERPLVLGDASTICLQ